MDSGKEKSLSSPLVLVVDDDTRLRKLLQKFRCTLRVCTTIYQKRRTIFRGNLRRKRRPSNSRQPLYQQRCSGQQCTGTASGNKCISLSGRQHLQTKHH